jgi:hypothetical protein
MTGTRRALVRGRRCRLLCGRQNAHPFRWRCQGHCPARREFAVSERYRHARERDAAREIANGERRTPAA